MNKMVLFGGIVRVDKRKVPDTNSFAYNVTIAATDGYGEKEQTVFYPAVLYSNSSKQEAYYDGILYKGNQLPFEGKMVTAKPYMNNGVKIVPWVFQIEKVSTGINDVCLSGRLAADATVTTKGDCVVVRYTIAVEAPKKEEPYYIGCVQFGKGGFADYTRKYLKKGRKIAIIGQETTGSYVNSSKKRVYTQEIKVTQMQLFDKDGKKKNPAKPASAPPKSQGNSYCQGETYDEESFQMYGEGFAKESQNEVYEFEDEELPF